MKVVSLSVIEINYHQQKKREVEWTNIIQYFIGSDPICIKGNIQIFRDNKSWSLQWLIKQAIYPSTYILRFVINRKVNVNKSLIFHRLIYVPKGLGTMMSFIILFFLLIFFFFVTFFHLFWNILLKTSFLDMHYYCIVLLQFY